MSAPAATARLGNAEGLLVPRWPAPASVCALITTRSGGVSTGPYASFNLGAGSGDDANAVAANRARLRGFLPADPLWLKQVHGGAVADADTQTGCNGEIEADAAVARGAGAVCAVMIADCLPVLLTDTAGAVVGVAHAGWRGLAAGVIEHTVAAMNVMPETLIAYLGPCIGGRVYEVGAEVREALCADHVEADAAFVPKAKGKWLADLTAVARQRLLRVGMAADSIFGGEFCTLSEPDRFYSFRRDGPSGRMAALIWRTRASA